jgi:hypothetical protein
MNTLVSPFELWAEYSDETLYCNRSIGATLPSPKGGLRGGNGEGN